MMSDNQFQALVKLVPLKAEAVRRGCYLVLVEGVPEPEAARQVGMTYRALWNAVKRCRVKIELARTVVGQ
ncbi:MAG: hypothetical protein ACMV1D_05015 [Macromonas sp.]